MPQAPAPFQSAAVAFREEQILRMSNLVLNNEEVSFYLIWPAADYDSEALRDMNVKAMCHEHFMPLSHGPAAIVASGKK
jgi:hypothetical protein